MNESIIYDCDRVCLTDGDDDHDYNIDYCQNHSSYDDKHDILCIRNTSIIKAIPHAVLPTGNNVSGHISPRNGSFIIVGGGAIILRR